MALFFFQEGGEWDAVFFYLRGLRLALPGNVVTCLRVTQGKRTYSALLVWLRHCEAENRFLVAMFQQNSEGLKFLT